MLTFTLALKLVKFCPLVRLAASTGKFCPVKLAVRTLAAEALLEEFELPEEMSSA